MPLLPRLRRWVLESERNVGESHLPDVVKVLERAVPVSDRDRINWDCRLVWDVILPKDAATGFGTPHVNRIPAKL